MGYCLKNKNYKFLSIQGDSYSIIQTLTGGRFQPLDTYKNVKVLRLKLLKIKHVEECTRLRPLIECIFLNILR
jgi:hypothetical protein